MGYTIQEYHTRYNRFARSRSAVRYIVVHYVGAGTSAAGSALANCKYFAGGNRNSSAHYFVDDGSIYECVDPATHGAWHVGDGHGAYGITNTNSIGIEVCNSGGPFTAAEIDRLTWLVQRLMAEYGVPASRVVRHYDASRKKCPAYYASDQGAWDSLRAQITGGKATGDNAPSGGSASSSGGTVEVDGYWGSATTRAAQAVAGTPADGVVSSQSAAQRSRMPGCTSGWEWVSAPKGSTFVRHLQGVLGVTADGIMGPDTINAFIRRYGNGVQDGRLDAPSVAIRGFQRSINSGRL